MATCGSLFVLEGSDDVGKTTLALGLAEKLRALGFECTNAAFPGQEPATLGQLVYRVHHDHPHFQIAPPVPAALQLLHIAAHVDAIERTILPALDRGRIVVLDRYWWSTIVYGQETGLATIEIDALLGAELPFWRGIVPCVVFLIQRSAVERSSPNLRIRDRYCALAQREQFRYPVHVIENDGTLEHTLDTMLRIALGSLVSPTLASCRKDVDRTRNGE